MSLNSWIFLSIWDVKIAVHYKIGQRQSQSQKGILKAYIIYSKFVLFIKISTFILSTSVALNNNCLRGEQLNMDDVRHYRLQLWLIGIFPQKLLNFDSFRHLLSVSFMVPWLFGRVDNILHSRVSILLQISNACIIFNLNYSFRIVSLITSVALMSGSCLWWWLGERQRPPTMAESPSGSKPPWGQLLMTPQPLFPPSLWISRMMEWEKFTQGWTKVSFAKKWHEGCCSWPIKLFSLIASLLFMEVSKMLPISYFLKERRSSLLDSPLQSNFCHEKGCSTHPEMPSLWISAPSWV